MALEKLCFSITLIIGFLSATTLAVERNERLLSLFNIVTFPNDPCDADTKNGTCYTTEECSNKGGTNDGSCASGYGVCCTFSLSCGSTIAENNTYWESGGSETGSCGVTICPCSDNICRLRLDFDSFTIAGPSTLTVTTVNVINGQVVNGGTATHSGATQCATDVFSVSNPGGASSPPTICGSNSNEHMYVDSSDQCNELSMLLGTTAVGTTLPTRSWTIRVTQIECGSDNLPPAGCTQYFFGSDTGTVNTYNYDGGFHLAAQNQVQCIRREKGNCKICYAATSLTDFSVSGNAISMQFDKDSCCSYGSDGIAGYYDCVIIDGLSNTSGKLLSKTLNNLCGLGGLASADQKVSTSAAGAMSAKTLCTKRQPFRLTFQSDDFENSANEVAKANPQIGYQLAYTMSTC